ncbi:hypothetical protein [Glycomyces harbinensis]|uniref:Uncharacterized protein n=1 Tax=Glycomyces harbinensis TaxID=58114 RepID=A0A1G6U0A5_9ACTN|nr:hypothetical protein [Glycomyces harbinensis]SDD34624.1 hypothetical protein SAMN05216270_103247 [Glycomyces harbinensis]
MRERRVGRVALPARLVAGAAGAAILVTAAPPAYAQDEEAGGELLCSLHGTQAPAGIVAAPEGDGWWIVAAGAEQNETLSIDRVGEDCNTRPDDEAFIVHQSRDPQALALDTEGGEYLWVGDIGEAADRNWITLNQIDLTDFDNNAIFRFVFSDEPRDIGSFLLLPGKKPLFISSDEGEATLFSPPGDNQTDDTPLDEVGTVALPEGGSVSGAALNADGTKVALRTENAVYEWAVDGDVLAALGGEPLTTPIADGGTAEGLAYDADGNFITLASTEGDDGVFGTVTRYAPAAPAAEEPAESEGEAAPAEEAGPSLVDRILDLGFGTIVKILAAIAILGLLVMIIGIVVIRKYKKAQNGDEDDESEMGFAAEESGFGKDEPFIPDDPVDLGLDAGQPDPDLGRVARGGVYGGAARQEPSGNVYGGAARPVDPAPPSGNVYGAAARPVDPAPPSGNVYGGAARPEPPAPPPPPRPEASGQVFGGREEPQYGAFEGGGHGSVYDNSGPGQSFTAKPEPSGNVYGAQPRPAAPAVPPGGSPPSGNVYGAGGSPQGSVYGAGNGERTPEADEGYWGPPDNGGSTYGRGR